MGEALANATEALAGHLALMRADADVLPPRALSAIQADPEFADDLEGAIVKTVEPTFAVHAK